MSLLDENIDISFETLLESLGWSKAERYGCSPRYIYYGLDCAQRHFCIEFYPKGYSCKVYDKSTLKKLHKDLWCIYYQKEYSSLADGMYYMGIEYDIRMGRENVIS